MKNENRLSPWVAIIPNAWHQLSKSCINVGFILILSKLKEQAGKKKMILDVHLTGNQGTLQLQTFSKCGHNLIINFCYQASVTFQSAKLCEMDVNAESWGCAILTYENVDSVPTGVCWGQGGAYEMFYEAFQ